MMRFEKETTYGDVLVLAGIMGLFCVLVWILELGILHDIHPDVDPNLWQLIAAFVGGGSGS